MKIKFWKRLSSDNNMHVDPTISTPILDLDGTLREGTSIITPEIVFESDEKILTCNYCYIQEFSRYYFVKDIQSLTNRLWKVSLSVDVLNSYKEYILSQTGFIERCDGTFNPDIEDKERDFEIEEEYEFIKTSDIMRDGAIIDKWDSASYASLNIVAEISCAWPYHEEKSGHGSTYDLYRSQYDKITAPIDCLHTINYTNLGDFYSSHIICSLQSMLSLLAKLNNTANINVSTLSIYPFAPQESEVTDSTGTKHNVVDGVRPLISGEHIPIYDGEVTIDTPKCYDARPKWYCLADFIVPDSYIESVESWIDYKRTILLFIPFVGWIDLNPQQVKGKNIKVYCLPQFSTQEGYFYVTANDTDILWSGHTIICQSVPLTSDNSRSIRDQNIQFAISTAISALNMTAGIALAPATSGISLIGSVQSGVSTIGKAVSMQSTRHNDVNAQIGSINQGVISPYEPILRISKPVLTDDITNYKKNFGLPLHKTMIINQLKNKGFTKITNVYLKGDSSITSTEKQMIISALENGVIL